MSKEQDHDDDQTWPQRPCAFGRRRTLPPDDGRACRLQAETPKDTSSRASIDDIITMDPGEAFEPRPPR